jgi:hypothetical protein
MRSAIELMPMAGLTATTSGEDDTLLTGARSFAL